MFLQWRGSVSSLLSFSLFTLCRGTGRNWSALAFRVAPLLRPPMPATAETPTLGARRDEFQIDWQQSLTIRLRDNSTTDNTPHVWQWTARSAKFFRYLKRKSEKSNSQKKISTISQRATWRCSKINSARGQHFGFAQSTSKKNKIVRCSRTRRNTGTPFRFRDNNGGLSNAHLWCAGRPVRPGLQLRQRFGSTINIWLATGTH